MAGGYFGFSTGSLAAGWWVQALDLQYFWLWALPGLVTSGLTVCSRLHRFEAGREESPPEPGRGVIPFGLTAILATAVAMSERRNLAS